MLCLSNRSEALALMNVGDECGQSVSRLHMQDFKLAVQEAKGELDRRKGIAPGKEVAAESAETWWVWQGRNRLKHATRVCAS